MSFDVSLVQLPCAYCNRGGETVFEFNLTHNVNDIVEACLVAAGAPRGKREGPACRERSWGRLDGWMAKDALPILQMAYTEVFAPRRHAEFRAMEPKNGWGKLSDVRRCLAALIAACHEHPDAVIEAQG